MPAKRIYGFEIERYIGTRAERLAMSPGPLIEFHETDYDAIWEGLGTVWRQKTEPVSDLIIPTFEDTALGRTRTYEAGNYKRLTASGSVKASPGVLVGFYVASTTGGTIILYDNILAAAPQIVGTITPSIGWHKLPVNFVTALYAAIGGTALDVTFVYI